MALALDELLRRAPGRDRLPHAPDGPATSNVRLCKLVPGVDDPSRVPADLVHVGERHLVPRRPQRLAQAPDLPVADSDHHRLAGRQPLTDKWIDPRDELVLASVQERLVPEGH